MHKKLSAILGVILVATLGLGISCFPVKTNTRLRVDRLSDRSTAIVALQMKSGEKRTLSKGEAGYIIGDRLFVGGPRRDQAIYLTEEKIKDVFVSKNYYAVETTEGKFHIGFGSAPRVKSLLIDRATYQLIPLSDVELVWAKKTNWPATFLASSLLDIVLLGLVATLPGDSGGRVRPSPQPDPNYPGGSCPLIFSYNGAAYALDAEPYGGALCRGLERVEWVGLDNLKAVEGRYRLLMTSEGAESDRTDELKLVVADHSPDVFVVPDVTGRMRTFSSASPPLAATEKTTGRDILSLVSSRDERFWVGRMEGKDPDDAEDLKDTLIFEFAKPAGARKAKLLANVWNTAWGVGAAKTLLEARGRTLPAWYAEIDAHGPAFWTATNWFAREDIFMLQARVETPAGWKTRALLLGSGAAVAKDKAYEIDLSDVPGDRVRIELTPASGFWMIERLALDFSKDLSVRVTEIAPETAVDGNGRDVRGNLAAADGRYQVLETAGARAEIVFLEPPQAPGTARTIFVKARGYYDIRVNTDAAPDETALRTLDTPGKSLRYLLLRHPVVAAGARTGAFPRGSSKP